jgi:hypothetical protein
VTRTRFCPSTRAIASEAAPPDEGPAGPGDQKAVSHALVTRPRRLTGMSLQPSRPPSNRQSPKRSRVLLGAAVAGRTRSAPVTSAV